MALVAFLPQHLSMMASVNNDALAEVLVALALLWLIRYLHSEHVPIWQLGLDHGRSAADEDHDQFSGAAHSAGDLAQVAARQ